MNTQPVIPAVRIRRSSGSCPGGGVPYVPTGTPAEIAMGYARLASLLCTDSGRVVNGKEVFCCPQQGQATPTPTPQPQTGFDWTSFFPGGGGSGIPSGKDEGGGGYIPGFPTPQQPPQYNKGISQGGGGSYLDNSGREPGNGGSSDTLITALILGGVLLAVLIGGTAIHYATKDEE